MKVVSPIVRAENIGFRIALSPAVHVLLCKTVRRWGLARFRQNE
jgi:hypothetical protein